MPHVGGAVDRTPIQARLKSPAVTASFAASRGLAIVIVVLFHADVVVSAHAPHHARFFETARALQCLALPAFFLSVGLAASRVSGSRHAPRMMTSAIVGYLYLYVVWTAISFGVTLTSIQMNVYISSTVHDVVRSVLFPEGPLWFLLALSAMFVSLLITAKQPRFVRISAALIAPALACVPHLASDFTAAATRNACCFFIGVLCRDEIVGAIRSFTPIRLLVGSMGVAIAVPCCMALGIEAQALPYTALGTAAFVCVCSCCVLSPIRRPVALLAAIGRSALPIYLTHDLWNHVAVKGLVAAGWIDRLDGIDGAVAPLLTSLFSICVCLASQDLLQWSNILLNMPSRLRDGIVQVCLLVMERLIIPRPSIARCGFHRASPWAGKGVLAGLHRRARQRITLYPRR